MNDIFDEGYEIGLKQAFKLIENEKTVHGALEKISRELFNHKKQV